MPKEKKNLPIDERWHDKTPLGNMANNHEFVDGEYVDKGAYQHQEYPKMKYHADYVSDRKPGVEYSYTQTAQQVESREEEVALGEDWADSPGELGIITAPDAAHESQKRKAAAAAGADWRKAVNGGKPEIGEAHLEFLEAAGADVTTIADVYALLATMTSAQMAGFLKEVAEAQKESKPTKSSKKQLVTA